MSTITLSQLPQPDVIELLDFETILAERKAYLVSLYPVDQQASIEATLALDSEPITKMLQENAYRELILRQRINESCMAVMLAYAAGADLDHLGANFNVQRLLIDAGDPDATPPRLPTYETDTDFRTRIQLSFEGISTAGSKGSYLFHALSADADVKDIDAVTQTPGNVTVYVLSRSGNGTASPDLLAAVKATLNADHTRPMTDQVTVQSAAIVDYTVEAELVILPGPAPDVVRQAAVKAITSYAEAQRKIGYDVTLSGVYASLHQPGVHRVNLTSPAANIAIGSGQSSYCSNITITVASATDV